MQKKGRQLHVRVKTAKGRKSSSTKWLQRQLNDEYVIMAQKEGYKSRAAYKLLEINEKYSLINPGDKIIDLGSTPGGWSQVAAKIVHEKKGGKILAIDLNEMDEIDGVEFYQKNFMDDDADDYLINKLDGKCDLVMSDMAASSCGHQKTDHLRIMNLCEAAFYFAKKVLKEDGSFLAKILRGGAENELLADLKRTFKTVKHFKPPASRKDSSEMYVIALGFKGAHNG